MSKNQSSLNLELLFDGHEALLTPTKKIKKITKKDKEVANEMHKLMRKYNGVGLSANQVGYDRSIVVMSIGPDNYTMFNPEIVLATDSLITSTEGCLSFPGVQCKVYRAARVLAKWQDSKGNIKIKWLDGLAGVCLQHELNHLAGRRFVEQSIEFLREKTKKEKEEQQNVEPQEKA
jgi:peptide deformylase